MKDKKHPFLDKVKEFFHRLKTKITLKFQGKNAVFTIEVDLTGNVYEQLKGIEHTLYAQLPDAKQIQEILTKKEA